VQVPERPKGPANIMPGGSAHTAGGKAEEDAPRYIDVVRNLGPEYYLNFHKRPCVRDSQLVGIGAGFVGGSLAAILRSMHPFLQPVSCGTDTL
jgi:cytochrome c oxidase assembly protein subunit 20